MHSGVERVVKYAFNCLSLLHVSVSHKVNAKPSAQLHNSRLIKIVESLGDDGKRETHGTRSRHHHDLFRKREEKMRCVVFDSTINNAWAA